MSDAAKEVVNIILWTSIKVELGEVVVESEFATGIEEEDQRRETTRRPAAANRNTVQTQSNGSYRPTFGGQVQSADQAPKKVVPLCNVDCRREPSKRQTPSAEVKYNVKKKDLYIFENQTNADDAGTEVQPPFFKQRRRQ